jgi:hypothetical protein
MGVMVRPGWGGIDWIETRAVEVAAPAATRSSNT